MLNKRLHGEFNPFGIMMLVGMLFLWATAVMVVLGIRSSPILFNAAIIFSLILFVQQRKSFLLYQKEKQALLDDEEGACTTCMTVWCLVQCNHGQIGSATGKYTVQTV